MGYSWEKSKEKKVNKIKLSREDLKCIECGKKIPRDTLTPSDKAFFVEHGAQCKDCMNKKFRPWSNKKK
jgi:NAD-dependent SIR2 family protein deacetylase